MIILGFDAGTNETGWCKIETRGGGSVPVNATYLDKGVVDSTFEAVERLLVGPFDVIAVESIEGDAFAGGSGYVRPIKHLLASATVAGGIAWAARALRLRVEEISAYHWRHAITGKGGVDNARVKDVVSRLVWGWPKTSNTHHRDAAGAALAIGWRLSGNRGAT